MSQALLSDDMKEVLQTFPGSYVSTVGDDLVPQITRVVGLKVADGDHVLGTSPSGTASSSWRPSPSVPPLRSWACRSPRTGPSSSRAM